MKILLGVLTLALLSVSINAETSITNKQELKKAIREISVKADKREMCINQIAVVLGAAKMSVVPVSDEESKSFINDCFNEVAKKEEVKAKEDAKAFTKWDIIPSRESIKELLPMLEGEKSYTMPAMERLMSISVITDKYAFLLDFPLLMKSGTAKKEEFERFSKDSLNTIRTKQKNIYEGICFQKANSIVLQQVEKGVIDAPIFQQKILDFNNICKESFIKQLDFISDEKNWIFIK